MSADQMLGNNYTHTEHLLLPLLRILLQERSELLVLAVQAQCQQDSASSAL